MNNDTITEPSGPPALDDMIRDAEFWMEDGSVVLAAGRVAFRVYKGLLGAQSPIFKQLFADSKPSAEEMLEGCPVVALSDPPEAVRHFLRALIHKDRPLYVHALQTLTLYVLTAPRVDFSGQKTIRKSPSTNCSPSRVSRTSTR